MKSYIELDVWIEARKLANVIYAITNDFPKEELYGITNQIRRCSVSIPSNIAEGCGRQTPKDIIRFLYISRGSLYELETQLYISSDLNFISEEKLNNVLSQIETCKKLLNGFINYYKKL
ncbi:four helix bundle protein [Tamlana sp. s12]|uniref:four helix bundle protein n=1 Tax=Tamlana sp. s12 TaxID=1630406 RepID=UPI00080251F9|nr:four helix bundle protein [Tamlana sp. s12]OBQ57369.1 30S ribosomal protein S23 [Tamlana sp. s12]QQY82429.1 four helix bundle protein [Tamlana sp. s12]